MLWDASLHELPGEEVGNQHQIEETRPEKGDKSTEQPQRAVLPMDQPSCDRIYSD